VHIRNFTNTNSKCMLSFIFVSFSCVMVRKNTTASNRKSILWTPVYESHIYLNVSSDFNSYFTPENNMLSLKNRRYKLFPTEFQPPSPTIWMKIYLPYLHECKSRIFSDFIPENTQCLYQIGGINDHLENVIQHLPTLITIQYLLYLPGCKCYQQNTKQR
jgi:hypothetical protein